LYYIWIRNVYIYIERERAHPSSDSGDHLSETETINYRCSGTGVRDPVSIQ